MKMLTAEIAQLLSMAPMAGYRLFFYMNSSILICMFQEVLAPQSWLDAQCAMQGGVLLSVNPVKNTAVLHATHNDVLCVRAPLNLDLLKRLNQRVGGDFDPAQLERRMTLTQVRQWTHALLFPIVCGRRLSWNTSRQ